MLISQPVRILRRHGGFVAAGVAAASFQYYINSGAGAAVGDGLPFCC